MGHQGWITGTPQFRNAIRPRLAAAFPAKGGTDIYLSRTRLVGVEKAVDKEQRIERLMARAGYEIFHPQDHDVATQIAQYRAARRVVGPDGSALHLAACAVRSNAKVAIIQRRHREKIVQSFVNQLEAFGVADVQLLNPLVAKNQQGMKEAGELAPLNFRLLSRQLQENGFL